MDAKSLKKLNRRELLEVMVKISEQNEALGQENQALRLQLENRRLSAREVGSLAQASLEATDLFIAADSAAKVYLENIMRIEKETQERANLLLEETLTECINMRAQSGFGPDELIPPDWRLPADQQVPYGGAAPDPMAAVVSESAIANAIDDVAAAGATAEGTAGETVGAAAGSSNAAGALKPKKEKKKLFGRKKKQEK